jgi:hypothetical protein
VRYAGPDASVCAARASACVSMYSRIFVSLPSRTVLAKIGALPYATLSYGIRPLPSARSARCIPIVELLAPRDTFEDD